MPHPYEPSLEKLHEIQKDLFTQPSTDENMKKLKAVEVQIERIKKEQDDEKARQKQIDDALAAAEKAEADAKAAQEAKDKERAERRKQRQESERRPSSAKHAGKKGS